MTQTKQRRPGSNGAAQQTAGEHVKADATPDAEYHARFALITHLNTRQVGLLRAMAGAGPCRYANDASCLMCSGLSLVQLAAAVRLHGPVLRRYASDVTAIGEVVQRVCEERLAGDHG